MTSTTKTKATQYDLPGIENMVPNIWSPVKVAYDKHANSDLGREGDFPRLRINDIEDISMVIQKRVKDLQMLMRSDELYKFSDGTLTRLCSLLDDITKNIQMEYLPKRRWSTLEMKRAHIVIKAIDKQPKERRMMRSLEKFIGGRHYGTDL
ncbi:hypothetical protein Tco_1474517 [Tanacetum coccineum]